MSTADRVLVERWRTQRDADAFAEIARRYAGMVFATGRRILGDAAAAEDVAQECFLELAEGTTPIRSSLGGWLHAMATHRSLDRLRSERRRAAREQRYAEQRPVQVDAAWDDVQRYVDEAIAALPDALREPVVRHFFAGESYSDLAESLGIPRSTAAHRVQKGVESIRTTLKKRGIGVSAAALAGMLAAQAAEAAPATLAAALARLAMAGTTGHAAATVPLALVGILTMKTKLLIGAGLVLAVLAALFVARSGARDVPGTISKAETPVSIATPAVEASVAVETPPEPAPAVAAAVEDASGTATVVGKVRDGRDRPLPGARVEIRRQAAPAAVQRTRRDSTFAEGWRQYHPTMAPVRIAASGETAEDGSYRLTGVPAGEELLVTAARAEWACGSAELAPLKVDEVRDGVDLKLAEGARIAGVVVDDAGAPVGGARVRLWNARPLQPPRDFKDTHGEVYGGLAEVLTGEDGAFVLAGVPRGWAATAVTAEKEGYGAGVGWHAASLTGKDAQRAYGMAAVLAPCEDLRIVLQPYSAVEGRVTVGGNGEPAAGADVLLTASLRPRGPGLEQSYGYLMLDATATADGQGRYRVSGFPPGIVRLEATWRDRVSPYAQFDLVPGRDVPGADLVVDAPGTLEGTVYDSTTGKPLRDVGVSATERTVLGAIDVFLRTKTDAAGRYRIAGCRAGSLDLSEGAPYLTLDPQRHGEGVRSDIEAKVAAGETTKVDLYLIPEEQVENPWRRVTGCVTDGEGRAVPGATVAADVSQAPATTDAQGNYELQIYGESEQATVVAMDSRTMLYGTGQTALGPEGATLDLRLSEPGSLLSGRILTPEGKPAAAPLSVQLQLQPGQIYATPGAEGRYSFGPVPPLRFQISASASRGYRITPSQLEVRPEPGADVDGLDFVVEPMTQVLDGVVLRPDGSPAANRRLQLTGGGLQETSVTDTEGRFHFENVGGEELTLTVGTSPESDPEWAIIRGLKPGTQDLVVRIEPAGTLKGVLSLPEGAAGVGVRIMNAELSFVFNSGTLVGPFRLALPPDTYTLLVTGDGIQAVVFKDLVVRAGQELDLGVIQPAAAEP